MGGRILGLGGKVVLTYIDQCIAESAINSLIRESESDPGMNAYVRGHRDRLVHTLREIPIGRRDQSILDIGTTGFMLSVFGRLLNYKTCVGILYKECGAPKCGNLEYMGADFPVIYLDAERDPYPLLTDSFDIVTCFEVIEHFTSDPMFFLQEVRRCLKENGVLIISTPNSVSGSSLNVL